MTQPLRVLAEPIVLSYIGPGAGFAVAGSFLAVFAAVSSALVMVVAWPVRSVARMLFQRRPPLPPRVRRVVILGLDGLDHQLTRQLLDEGKLPHLARLRDQGTFVPLASTLPPISPVAWSTFQTGVNPGKHNIFDFLVPDEHTYEPKLSSVEIRPPARGRFGRFRSLARKPEIRGLRKSTSFWKVLSDYGVFNCVLRVPISYPPERLRGLQLSAMCVPDLRGTQGVFSLFTTCTAEAEEKTGGDVQRVTREGRTIRSRLVGPPGRQGRGPLTAPFTVTLQDSGEARLAIGRERHVLRVGRYTGWVRVRFREGLGPSVWGICRFLLLSIEPEFRLYVTPIHVDPERPALPIGSPPVFPVYLAKRQGPYATLGLAEDTWGLNEHVLDDDAFLQQCIDIDAEREAMFFDALDKVRRGLCVCVFDSTDRMQHMFWRYHDEQHPARPADIPAQHAAAVEDLYRRMDALVGRTIDRCAGTDTLLMVLSDHGFTTFRRGVDLNRWLEEQGYLVVDDGRRGDEHLAGVDWSRTRAFAIGLTGIFLNLQGRFAQGIVDPGEEAERLRDEIVGRLGELVDPQTGTRAVRRAYVAPRVYRGPYRDRAPDVIVGYESGYRVSWEAAIGRTTRQVFHDNTRAWSGDHCVDPSVVPGVLFCNRALNGHPARLLDIGPTVLNLFGIPAPAYMDGKPLTLATAVDG